MLKVQFSQNIPEEITALHSMLLVLYSCTKYQNLHKAEYFSQADELLVVEMCVCVFV